MWHGNRNPLKGRREISSAREAPWAGSEGLIPKVHAGWAEEPHQSEIPRLWCRADTKVEVAGRVEVPSILGRPLGGLGGESALSLRCVSLLGLP